MEWGILSLQEPGENQKRSLPCLLFMRIGKICVYERDYLIFLVHHNLLADHRRAWYAQIVIMWVYDGEEEKHQATYCSDQERS